MARSIQDMEPGDFVKVAPGRYEEIASVSPGVAPNGPPPKCFHVVTKKGNVVSMYRALSYYKKDDPRP